MESPKGRRGRSLKACVWGRDTEKRFHWNWGDLVHCTSMKKKIIRSLFGNPQDIINRECIFIRAIGLFKEVHICSCFVCVCVCVCVFLGGVRSRSSETTLEYLGGGRVS